MLPLVSFFLNTTVFAPLAVKYLLQKSIEYDQILDILAIATGLNFFAVLGGHGVMSPKVPFTFGLNRIVLQLGRILGMLWEAWQSVLDCIILLLSFLVLTLSMHMSVPLCGLFGCHP